MNCNICYCYPCVCITPCSTLPCDITIKDYTPCPRDCYQVWVAQKYNLITGQLIPGHYEYICKNGTQPPQPHPHPQPQPPLIGGCAGTRYGCCPDGITSRADYQGSNCPQPQPPLIGGCAGTQYGCCSDGVTARADFQGSNCPQPQPPLIGGCAGTRYGCCSDGVTSKADEQGSNCSNLNMACLPTCPTKCHDTCMHYQARQ